MQLENKQESILVGRTNGNPRMNAVTKDLYEAAYWFQKAAAQNNQYAQYNLALCYENGIGVDKDPAEAVKWYQKAANQGNAKAKEALQRLGR